MKRLVSIISAVLLLLSAASCAGDGESAANGNGTANAPTQEDIEAIKRELAGGIAGEITVSCYDSVMTRGFLEDAVALFEEKYPGTKINLESYSEMPEIRTDGQTTAIRMTDDDSQKKEEYITETNTRLMGGRGADVFAVDVLPFYKYAEAGQFENLRVYMGADEGFDIADYRQNIIEASAYKNGLYIFPIAYSFNYIAFDGSLFGEEEQALILADDEYTFQELIGLGLAAFDRSGGARMFGLPPNRMFASMFEQDYGRYVDIEKRTANFNDGQFAELLKTVMEYSENGYISEAVRRPTDGSMPSMNGFVRTENEQYLFKSKSIMQLLQTMNTTATFGVRMYSSGTGNEDNDEIAGFITGSGGEKKYEFTQAYAINSNSGNKALAWEFVKFLAGEEMQTSSMRIMGLPVNRKALEERTKQQITGELFLNAAPMMPGGPGGGMPVGAQPDGRTEGQSRPQQKSEPGVKEPDDERQRDIQEFLDGISSEMDAEQQAVYDEYLRIVNTLSNKVNTYLVKDTIIENIIDTEVNAFFEGTKTADEAAAALQNKVQLYLDE